MERVFVTDPNKYYLIILLAHPVKVFCPCHYVAAVSIARIRKTLLAFPKIVVSRSIMENDKSHQRFPIRSQLWNRLVSSRQVDTITLPILEELEMAVGKVENDVQRKTRVRMSPQGSNTIKKYAYEFVLYLIMITWHIFK